MDSYSTSKWKDTSIAAHTQYTRFYILGQQKYQLERCTQFTGVYPVMGSCQHGMARLQFADGGTTFNMKNSCEYIE